MLSAAVVACLFVATSAHMMGQQQTTGQQQMKGQQNNGMTSQQQNMLSQILNMGNQGMNNQGMNNMGMNNQGMNNMGMNNQGMNNMGMNNQGMNNMGMNNQGMYNQGMNMNTMRNQNQGMGMGNVGMMGGIMTLLLQNVLNNNQGQNNNNQMKPDAEEMKEVEEMMKMKMMAEMADMMMANMEYKKKEAEFTMAMDHMCWLMTATYENYRRANVPAFNKTTDDSLEDIGKMSMSWTEEQKTQFAITMMNDEPQQYAEIFLRLVTKACVHGEEYAEAIKKMERINKGEGECRR